MCSPYAVCTTAWHWRRKSTVGSIAIRSIGRDEMAAKKVCAMLQHKDGGYSFKPAVLHCPSAFLPIVDALRFSVLTLCLWRLNMNCGRFKRSKLVGLGDIAPMSPWQNLIFSALGSSSSRRMSGRRHMDAAEGTSVGSAGCSMKA